MNAGTLDLVDSVVRDSIASKAYGGAISNTGRLTLTRTRLSGNTDGEGAAVYTKNSGTLTAIDRQCAAGTVALKTRGSGASRQR